MSSQLQVSGEAKIRDIQGPVVANSGVITALDGAASQYVRGDGTLADFPTSSGGGSSVSYYLNSSVSQGTIGGVAYRELSKEPIIGAGTDIAISANGYVASYLTDANDPDVLSIPGGNFNCEFYFSVNNNTGNPFFYAELYKYDGTTFTLLGSSVGVPEYINQGTIIAPYYFAIPVPTSALALTDRLSIRIYVNVDGRTVTLHTENGHLCQVVTTLSKGMVSLNNLTDQSQFITTGTSGTDFNIVSSGDTHTLNIPSASASNRGLITTGAQTIGGSKTFSSAISGDAGVLLKNGFTTYSNSYTSLGGNVGNLVISGSISSSPFDNELAFTPSTSNTYTFPDLSGTLALLEGNQEFSGYKTFTGGAQFTGTAGTYTDYGIAFTKGSTPTPFSSGTTNLYSDATTNNIVIRDTSSNAKLVFNNSTQTYTFPALSGTMALLEGSQTFTGLKTFGDSIQAGYGISLYNGIGTGALVSATYTGFYAAKSGTYTNITFAHDGDPFFSRLKLLNNATYDYTFPALSGTLALTSNLSSYVPYSGATSDVNLGVYSITSNLQTNRGVVVNDSSGTANALNLKTATSGQSISGAGYVSLVSSTVNYLSIFFGNSTVVADFNASIISARRTYTLPDASGTIALTSNLSGYLPLAGGTLTGALNFTAGANINLGTTDNFALFLRANNTNILTLFPSGNAGINAGGSDTGERFQVTGTTRLNGALSGTSATFSDAGTSSNSNIVSLLQPNFASTFGPYLSLGVANSTNNAGVLQFNYVSSGSNSNAVTLALFGKAGLSINGTGAATFSSSVTAGGVNTFTSGGFSSTSFPLNASLSSNASAASVAPVARFSNNGGGFVTKIMLSDNNRGDAFITHVAGSAFVPSSRWLGFGVDAVDQMIINASGNVGIGTSSPSEKLDINGALAVRGSTLGFASASGVGVLDQPTTGITRLLSFGPNTSTLGSFNFYIAGANNTSGITAMTITSGGNVLIGTTSSNGWPLEIAAAGGGEQIYLKRSGANAQIFMGGATGADTLLFIRANGSNGVYLPSGGIAWVANSDERLKTDLVPINDAINKVNSLRSVVGRYKTDKEGTKRAFLIAQDVLKVLPEAVNKNEETGDLGVSYTEIIPLLVAAIKELKAQIEELKALIKNK